MPLGSFDSNIGFLATVRLLPRQSPGSHGARGECDNADFCSICRTIPLLSKAASKSCSPKHSRTVAPFFSPIYLQEPSAETLFPHGEGKPSLESRPAALDYGLYQGGGGLGIKGLCDLMGFRGGYRSQVTFPGVFASMHQPSRVRGWWRSGCPPKAAGSGIGGVIFLVLVGGQC